MVFTDSGSNYGGDGSVTSLGSSGADKLNAEITKRKSDEKAVSDAAAQKVTDKATADENTFVTNRQKAYDDTLAAVRHSFTLQGLNPDDYMASDITPALTKEFNSVPDLAPNPSAAFLPTTATDILSGITSGGRTKATNALNSTFDPNYSSTLIPDSALNPFVSSAVSAQFDPLSAQLTNAQKRGTLTPTGYNAALDTLAQKRASATSDITNLGNKILTTDRSGIDDIISGAKDTATGLGAGQAFDPSTYVSKTKSLADTDLNNLGGAITSAIGDTKYATLTDLLNAGGSAQGASNPSAINPTGTMAATSPFASDPNVLANQKRGLGNQGAF